MFESSVTDTKAIAAEIMQSLNEDSVVSFNDISELLNEYVEALDKYNSMIR